VKCKREWDAPREPALPGVRRPGLSGPACGGVASPACVGPQGLQAVNKHANRHVWGFGWGMALTRPFRDARRFPSTRWYPVLGGYAYDVGVWDLSIVQGPFSVAPWHTLVLRFATFASLERRS
jgi:hypothetical protein